jgi:hypothetical protein
VPANEFNSTGRFRLHITDGHSIAKWAWGRRTTQHLII